MRAAVLHALDAPLTVDDVELLPPGPGQVRVRVRASGVCRSDLAAVHGEMPFPLPVVLGHEGAGEVVEVGDGVTTLVPGDHVVLSWIAPCRRCRFCLRGRVELCEHGIDHAYAGSYAKSAVGEVFPGFGTATFAEETVVPESAAVRIDPDLPFALAALIGCAAVTGVGAVIRTARVRPGETVAVVGCGGVGLSAVQGARLAGAAQVIAVDTRGSKLDLARACGATDVVDASAGDAVEGVRSLTGGFGVDHAIEVVGRSTTIRQAYDMASRGGTVTIVGAGRFDDVVGFGAMQLMVDAKTVQGCLYGATDPQRDVPAMVRLQQQGGIDLERLVTRRIGLDDIDDAFRAMEAGEVARSVVVL